MKNRLRKQLNRLLTGQEPETDQVKITFIDGNTKKEKFSYTATDPRKPHKRYKQKISFSDEKKNAS